MTAYRESPPRYSGRMILPKEVTEKDIGFMTHLFKTLSVFVHQETETNQYVCLWSGFTSMSVACFRSNAMTVVSPKPMTVYLSKLDPRCSEGVF